MSTAKSAADPDVFVVELRIATREGGAPAPDPDSLMEILAEDLEGMSVTCLQPLGGGRGEEDQEFAVSVLSVTPRTA